MRRIVFSVFLSQLIFFANAQTKTAVKNSSTTEKRVSESGYNIPVTITPYKNCWVYLATYYGKYKNLVDSTWFDANSKGVFKGDKKLPGGIYFLVSPEKTTQLFEVLMDEKQHFSIVADTSSLENVTITGSAENTLFQDYTKYLSKNVPQLTALQNQLKSAGKTDSVKIQEQIKALNKNLNDYRENIVKSNPNSMLALFFNAVKRPEVETKAGEEYPYYYVREHYWDDVSFNDDRLLHTPFFDPKLEEYFKYYVSPEPDSIIAEVNYMLLSARTSNEMFKYLLGRFTDKYINPEIMGQDNVFLFLFDNYYSKGDTSWLTKSQKEFIFNRAYSLIANQIGEPAPTLDLIDTLGKPRPLYSVEAPFTFVLFWDPTCSHCKVEVPRVDSIYNANWKAEGVKISAVNVADETLNTWKKYISENKLNNWIHVYQPKEIRKKEEAEGKPNFRQLYDVFQTPTMYLLDKNKHIIAKRLSIEQFDELMHAKSKKQ